MTDIIGPADAPNFTTSRPADDRSIGSTDTWMKDCTGPTANDGTKVKAAWLNAVIGLCRSLIRGNGNTGGGSPVVTEDNADDMALRAVQHLIQRGQPSYAADSGSANALVASLSPAAAEYKTGLCVRVKVNVTNTGTSTINLNALGTKTIKRVDGDNLHAGDLVAGAIVTIAYDGTNFQWISVGASAALPSRDLIVYSTPGSFNWVVPAGVTRVFVEGWGGGGGGGGTDISGRTYPPAPGGGGAYFAGWFSVTPGDTVVVTVGAGGTKTIVGGSNSTAGGTTSFGALASATGGGAGHSARNSPANIISTAGAATGGQINLPGQTSMGAYKAISAGYNMGTGGNAPRGGNGGASFSDAGNNGTQPGGGGGAGGSGNGTDTSAGTGPANGGNGGAGMLLITW